MKMYFSALDFATATEYFKKKLILKIMFKVGLYVLCYGCVIWQSSVCLEKYLSKPTGASLEIIDTQVASISFTFCEVIYNLNQNSNGRLFQKDIKHLKEIKLQTNNLTIYLKQENESVHFNFIIQLPEPYLCREFKLPQLKIESIEVKHDARSKKKNFHLFIHPGNMITAKEFIIQYPNKIFHGYNDGYAKLKIKSYDLSASPEIACADINYYKRKFSNVLAEYNKTMGCAYPFKRYSLPGFALTFTNHVNPKLA